MADFDGAVEIKTIRDNETKIILVDGASGTSATKKLSIADVGDAVSAGVNDFGVPVLTEKAGNYALLKQGAEGLLTQITDAAGDDLDINPDGSVKIGDGTNVLAISATGEASVSVTKAQGVDGATAPVETLQVGGKDGSGNLQTISTDSSGNVNVNIVPNAGITKVMDYQTTATVGSGSVVTHDYVITNLKTFTGLAVLVGARGQVEVRVGTYNGTTFTPKLTYFQQPKENIDHIIPCLTYLGDGTNAIRVEITNLDGSSSNVYSTLQGTEE